MEHLIHHTHLGFDRMATVEEYYQALCARYVNDAGLEAQLGSSEQGCGSVTGVRNDFEIDNDSDPALRALALSEMEKDQIITSITAEIMEALNAEGEWGAGFLPAGLIAMASAKWDATRTPWERELDEYLRPVITRVRKSFLPSFKKINRRRPSSTTASGRKVINPGKSGKNFSAVFYADRSGSMAAHEIQMAEASYCAAVMSGNRRAPTVQAAPQERRQPGTPKRSRAVVALCARGDLNPHVLSDTGT